MVLNISTSKSMHEVDRLKIGAAARYIGVSIDTLRRWERDGKINVIKTKGGTRFYAKTELDRMKAQEKEDNFVSIGYAAQKLGVSIKTLRRWDKSERLIAKRDETGRRLYDSRFLFRPVIFSKEYFLNKRQSLTHSIVFGGVVLGVMGIAVGGYMVAPIATVQTKIEKPTSTQIALTGETPSLIPQKSNSMNIYNNVGYPPFVTEPSPLPLPFDITVKTQDAMIPNRLPVTVNKYPKASKGSIEYLNDSSAENLHLVE